MSYADHRNEPSRSRSQKLVGSVGGGSGTSGDVNEYESVAYQSNYSAPSGVGLPSGNIGRNGGGVGEGGGGTSGGGSNSNYGIEGGSGSGTYFTASKPKTGKGVTGSDSIKAMMASVKGDHYKVIVVKATTSEMIAPKGKHVRAIIGAIQMGGMVQDRSTPVGAVFYHMRKRLQEPDWVVILKTLTVYHHVFRQGNEKFVEYFTAQARGILDYRKFSGAAVAANPALASFVKSYSNYLMQWCAMKCAINFPPGKIKDDDTSFATSRYNTDEKDSEVRRRIFREMPVLFDTLDALVRLDLDGQIRYSTVATPTFMMIVNDVCYVWLALTQAMLILIESFFESDLHTAKISFEFYRRIIDTIPTVRDFFTILEGLGTHKTLPEVNVVTSDLKKSMEDYIEDLQRGDEKDVEYSDEEVVPEPYYEPPVDYFSESDPEPEYVPPPRAAPRRPKSESSSESSSSESEEEVPIPMPMPQPMPQPTVRPFDPLTDILGMSQMTVSGGQMMTYQQPAYQQPGFQNSGDARVQSIKAVMNGVQQQRTMAAQGMVNGQQMLALPPSTAVPQQQQHMMGGGAGAGAGGGGGLSNVYAQMQAAQMQRNQNAQQQMLQQQQQQQQQYATQNQAAMYATMAGGQYYQTNAGMQMVPVQQTQMGAQAYGMGVQMPAMQAMPAQVQQQNYRVQAGPQQYVNASDQAFRGLDNGVRRN